MKFPLMDKGRSGVLEIDKFDGGLNRRDLASAVEKNQLTECQNMWYKERVLKTRPSLFSSPELVYTAEKNSALSGCDVKAFREVRYVEDGESFFLLSIKREATYGENRGTEIEFYWLGDKRIIPVSTLEVSDTGVTFFVILHRLSLYCYLSNQKIYRLDGIASGGKWTEISDDDIYIPLVATNLSYIFDFSFDSEQILDKGIRVEGVNSIGSKMRLLYSTVNLEYFEKKPQMAEHAMVYYIPYVGTALDLVPTHFKVTVNYRDGVQAVHRVQATERADTFLEMECNRNDEYKIELFCSGDSAFIWFMDKDDNHISIAKSEFVENNMEIITPVRSARRDTIFSMQSAEWFGGASSGIGGGTRLFLGAGSDEKEKNLVAWSGLNNPLYFPEYNYFYVGDSMGAVTGFGKQSDMLVIFKENETYFTQYKSIKGLSSDENINGASDFKSTAYYFPLTLVNSNIGCTLPDTVQLCRNRLVWANKDGRIYTLMSNDQYSERNIFEVGSMVSRDLKKEDLTNACSCDWEGHYALKTHNGIYLMDYNSAGFENADSYIKNEDANIRIPWYYWRIGEGEEVGGMTMATADRSLVLLGVWGSEKNVIVACRISEDAEDSCDIIPYLTDDGVMFNSVPIVSSFTTSFFDFDAPSRRKNIDRVCLSLGSNNAQPMLVDFLSDCGTVCEEIVLQGDKHDINSPQYIHSKMLCPNMQAILRLGVRISCEGTMAMDSMSIYYKMLGFSR